MVEQTHSLDKRRHIDHYRVLSSLGAGGMAEVYRVEDTQTQAVCALKIHYMPTDDQAIALAYHREYRALLRCEHPHVVKVLAHGVSERRPYLVMEYVDGLTLLAHMEKHAPQPGPERDQLACALAYQLAGALDHLHGRHLVHRDLKPENLLVLPDHQLKLIDFGIARDLGHEGSTPDAQDNDVVGTYAYCSPEQASGQPVDHRSDLYSFGVLLYQLVTGQLPFVAEQAIAFILKHVSQPPEPPEQYYPAIPARLKELILKLLEKNPLDRPQSGRDIQRALTSFLPTVEARRQVDAPRGQPEQGRLFEPAFVGRSTELGGLRRAVARLKDGHRGVLLVVGEVGSGRSRLLDAGLADARAQGIPVYTARFTPGADRPYQGLLELLEALVADREEAVRQALLLRLSSYGPILAKVFPSIQRLIDDLGPGPEVDPRLEPERLSVAVKALVEVVLTGPTVMAIRDLHWADPASMLLLSSLTLEPSGGTPPVLWLASVASDEMVEDHRLLAWLNRPPYPIELLRVSPLSLDETEGVVRSMLGGTLSLGPVVPVLHREARGNPLFIAEAVRGLVERGILVGQFDSAGEQTGWKCVAPPGGGLQEAVTMREILRTRLQHLTAPTLEVVERMAVLNRPCSFEWLLEATGRSRERLLDSIDELLSRRLMIERKGGRSSVFSFYHPRMAAVVQEKLSGPRLELLHRQVAGWWLTVHGNSDPASISLLGIHYFRGRAFDQAMPYLLLAAESRMRLGLFEAARERLLDALECTEHDAQSADLQATVHLRLGLTLQYLNDYEQAWTHLREAYRLASQANLVDLKGQSLYILALLYSRQGDYATSAKRFAEALKLQRDARDANGLVKSLNGLAFSLWHLGDYPHARRFFDEAATQARASGETSMLTQAMDGQALVALRDGRLEEALNLSVEAATLSRSSGRDTYYLVCQVHEAEVRLQQGELGSARAMATSALERIERLGEQDLLAPTLNTLAAIALEMRDIRRTEELLLRSGRMLNNSPQLYVRAVRQLLVGQLELTSGRPVEAQAGLKEALNIAMGSQFREIVVRARRYLAWTQVLSGDIAEGMRRLQRAIQEAEHLALGPGRAEAHLFLVEGMLMVDDRDAAQAQLEDVIRSLRTMNLRLLLIRALAFRGRLDFDAGLEDRARRWLTEGVGLLRDVRQGLTAEERPLFDGRSEVKLLSGLWRRLTR